VSQQLAEEERSQRSAGGSRDAAEIIAHHQRALEEALTRALPPRELAPARLHAAMWDAVFPGGRRARPLLCLLVAERYGQGDDELVMRMATAVELVHCASLVQDDMPCFDDADTRRGRPSIHKVYGDATAILVGDALLTLAFEVLSQAPQRRASTAFRLFGLLASAAGSSQGIIGGQGLELEPSIDLDAYHRQKTAALFRAAAAGAAVCVGAESDVARWARVGELLGCALQLRDDIDDVEATPEAVGKPIGRDAALGRPNAALQDGVGSARALRQALIDGVAELLGPPSPETEALRLVVDEATRPAVRR
jgi:geranylgeranyl diphosphate synthase type II